MLALQALATATNLHLRVAGGPSADLCRFLLRIPDVVSEDSLHGQQREIVLDAAKGILDSLTDSVLVRLDSISDEWARELAGNITSFREQRHLLSDSLAWTTHLGLLSDSFNRLQQGHSACAT